MRTGGQRPASSHSPDQPDELASPHFPFPSLRKRSKRSNVRFGSIASVWLCAGRFRSAPKSGRSQRPSARLKGAMSGSRRPARSPHRHGRALSCDGHSGNPARRNPSSYRERSSARRKGLSRSLRLETRSTGLSCRSRAIALILLSWPSILGSDDACERWRALQSEMTVSNLPRTSQQSPAPLLPEPGQRPRRSCKCQNRNEVDHLSLIHI